VSGSPAVVIVVVKTVVSQRGETSAFHRFLIPGDIPGDPELTIGCVEGGEAIT